MQSKWLIALVLVLAPQAALAGTVAHYRFDNDPSALIAADETGVNPGQIIGGASHSSSVGQNPISQTGQANSASLSLSNSTPTAQYVSVPHNNSLSFGSNPWTIEAYINLNTLPTTAVAGQWIAQKKDLAIDDAQDYGLLVGGNRAGLAGTFGKSTGLTGQELVVELGRGVGNGWTSITSTLEVPAAGTWVFVSAAYDGGTSLRFTLDTNLNDNLPGLVDLVALPGLTNVTNAGNLFIGAKRNAAGAPAQLFNGLIDEVRISDEVLGEDALLSVQAVPEPSSLVLAALAGFACLAIRRRRQTA